VVPRPAAPTALALWATALLGLGAATLVIAWAEPGYALSMLSTSPLLGAVALLAAGWVPGATGLAVAVRRPSDRTGSLLLAVAVLWFAAGWGSPGAAVLPRPAGDLLFTAGLTLALAVPAPLAHLALAYPGGRLRSATARVGVLAGYVLLVAVATAGTFFVDPAAGGCTCPANLLLVADRPALATPLARGALGLGLAWVVAAVAVVTATLVRATPAARRLSAPVCLCTLAYLMLTAVAFAAGLDRGYLSTTSRDRQVWLGQAVALVALSASVAWGLLRVRRVQSMLARTVLRPASGDGAQLRDELADLLADPGLVIAHRLDDGRLVDADGHSIAAEATSGRQVTELSVDGAGALLFHRPGALDSPVLVEELVSAAGLALTNDRLRARSLDQLAELRASQARIVRTADDERRRLERDLHDGAQQRLVGILLALRLLRTTHGADGTALLAAEQELERAIDDLRDLSRGLFPAVLGDEGLCAAVHALAETHRLTVREMPAQRLAASVETTAYLVVARAAAAGPAVVGAVLDGGSLVVTVVVERAGPLDTADLRDRVEALGGSLKVSVGPQETRVELHLPLAEAP
jgi:signal transduction histidine kinase